MMKWDAICKVLSPMPGPPRGGKKGAPLLILLWIPPQEEMKRGPYSFVWGMSKHHWEGQDLKAWGGPTIKTLGLCPNRTLGTTWPDLFNPQFKNLVSIEAERFVQSHMMWGKVEDLAGARGAVAGRDSEDCVEEGALDLEFWALAMDYTTMWVLYCVTSVIPSLASVFSLIKWGIDLNTFWGSWLWSSKIKEGVLELEEKVESTSPRDKGIPGGGNSTSKDSNWK